MRATSVPQTQHNRQVVLPPLQAPHAETVYGMLSRAGSLSEDLHHFADSPGTCVKVWIKAFARASEQVLANPPATRRVAP